MKTPFFYCFFGGRLLGRQHGRCLRARCWRLVTEAQGFAGNGAPTRPVTGCAPGQNVGASQRRHKALPAMGRQLCRCPGRPFLFFGPGLVHRPPQGLVLSFPLHQLSGPFQRSAGTDLVHKSPQNLVLSSPLHQVSGPFQQSAGADLVHKPPQSLIPSFHLHQVSGPFRRSAGALKAEKENGRGHSPFPLSLNRKLPAGRRKLTNCYSYAVYRSSRYLYRSSASFMYCDAPENILDKLNR